MQQQGCLPVGRHQTCRTLASDPLPHNSALTRRQPKDGLFGSAPSRGFLAVDLITIKHEGERIEGVGRHYSSSTRGVCWGHTFTSSALVSPGQDPYLRGRIRWIRCDPFPDSRMATREYPKLTPSEALSNLVGDSIMAGYEFSGLLADAQFATKLSLRSLKLLGVPFLMRYRTNAKIIVGDKIMKVRELAERYPRGSARWYSKLERYVKRLKVAIPKVGAVDLLIVWKWQSRGWQLTALVSTIEGGVQEVMRAWKSRWSLEVSHRIRKQNLALGGCQCRSFAAHLKHADLVIEAFNLVREQRRRSPDLSWRAAQCLAAEGLESAMVTGLNAIAA